MDRDEQERRTAVDLVATNETYFFREPKHFDFICEKVLPCQGQGGRFHAWSAACSSGEEAYSLAMLFADILEKQDWNITATDISRQVFARAQTGEYPMARAERVPRDYLKRFCLRGVGAHDGTFLVDRPLRSRVRFLPVNLNAPLPDLGSFDLILLRNVLIYFDADTKQEVIARVLAKLKHGGIFMVGHSESLNGMAIGLRQLAPAIYQK